MCYKCAKIKDGDIMGASNLALNVIYQHYKNDLNNSRIDKIYKISNTDFCFILYNGHISSFIFSLKPTLPLLYKTNESFKSTLTIDSFTHALKKHFEGGIIIDSKQIENERIFLFKIEKKNATFQTIVTNLIVELIPHKSNILILDQEDKIIEAFHHSDSLDVINPIARGLKYNFKTKNQSIKETDTIEDLANKVSKKEYEYLKSAANLSEAINLLLNGKDLFVYKDNISKLPIENSKKINPDQIYLELKNSQEQNYLLTKFEPVFKLVKNKLSSLDKKEKNLLKDQKQYQNKLNYQEIGNLLYTYADQYIKGSKSINLDGIQITLDPLLDLNNNAKKYFKLYTKAKTGIQQIDLQLTKLHEEKEYFELINSQFTFATEVEMLEIIEQLKNDHYIKDNRKVKKNKKTVIKTYPIHYLTSKDGTKIGFGLSSFQNDYLTFTLANKKDLFLHIKDSHGPHVIIFADKVSDDTLLFALEATLYFSNKDQGDIVVTKKENVKKVPLKLGLVSFNSYQTYYINKIRDESLKIFKSIR